MHYIVNGQAVDANGKPVKVAAKNQLEGLSVGDALARVEAGDVTTAQARVWEEAQEKPRSTLLDALDKLDAADEAK